MLRSEQVTVLTHGLKMLSWDRYSPWPRLPLLYNGNNDMSASQSVVNAKLNNAYKILSLYMVQMSSQRTSRIGPRADNWRNYSMEDASITRDGSIKEQTQLRKTCWESNCTHTHAHTHMHTPGQWDLLYGSKTTTCRDQEKGCYVTGPVQRGKDKVDEATDRKEHSPCEELAGNRDGE